jgi:hypothetical protein
VKRVFFGFPYRNPYLNLYGEKLREVAASAAWDAVMPLGSVPGGLMLDRIVSMIRSCERAVFEVGTENGNVWFELGFSVGKRQGVALMSDAPVGALPEILRTAWLRPYASADDCATGVTGFLSLADVPPLVRGTRSAADPKHTVVIGNGDRTAAVVGALRAAGREVDAVEPQILRSISDAVAIADSSGAVVVVRPAGGSWTGHDAIAPLIALGAAFGLSRDVVLAAFDSEEVPSDCMDLVIRATDAYTLGDRVAAAFARPRPQPPPAGTTRPRIPTSIPHPLKAAVARVLREHRSAVLDAEPGYGKTTILTQTADELTWPTAWLTLETDWSLSDLLERVVASVGEHAPAFGWSALAASRQIRRTADETGEPTLGQRLPSPEAVAELMVSDAKDPSTGHVLLVVDDAHKASDEGGRLFARLIRVAPPWLHIAVAARGAPPDIARLSAAGLIPTFGSDALRFSPLETAAFLRLGGRAADDARIALLHARTEGWQAALGVIRVWLDANPSATTEQLREMARGDRHEVYHVFATDYFVNLAPGIREDLFKASLPIRLEPGVSVYLYGPDGGLRLRELADGPYFITEDGGASVFRVHSLFREFLAQRWIDERGRESLIAERARLARWYLDAHDSANAYQVGCEAEAWDVAVAAIEPVIRVIASAGDAYFVRDLLSKLPADRVRASRAVWESWVRALSLLGDPRALPEAERLVDTATADVADQALADFMLAELRYEHGDLSDAEMAAASNAIADRLSADHARLAVQMRLQAFGTKTIHTSDPTEWPQFLDEGEALARLAEQNGLPAVAAVALAEAGDIAGRMFETALATEGAQLRFAKSLNLVAPAAVRIDRAQHLAQISARSLANYREAFRLAEQASEPIPLAHVRLSFARFKTLQVINDIWRTGQITEETRAVGENAVRDALTAVETYAQNGIMRSVAIGLNAASEAASAINDRERMNDYSARAERVARERGYDDLAESSIRIRTRPTALESYRAASEPPPLHRWDEADLQHLTDEMLSMAGLSDGDREKVRPVLDAMLAEEVYLDSQREVICRYLALLQDLRGPKIGPFDATPPKWRVTCRLRGIVTVAENRKASALIRQFAAGVCSSCELRSPAKANADFVHDDDDVYRPMRERVTPEDAGTNQ